MQIIQITKGFVILFSQFVIQALLPNSTVDLPADYTAGKQQCLVQPVSNLTAWFGYLSSNIHFRQQEAYKCSYYVDY